MLLAFGLFLLGWVLLTVVNLNIVMIMATVICCDYATKIAALIRLRRSGGKLTAQLWFLLVILRLLVQLLLLRLLQNTLPFRIELVQQVKHH